MAVLIILGISLLLLMATKTVVGFGQQQQQQQALLLFHQTAIGKSTPTSSALFATSDRRQWLLQQFGTMSAAGIMFNGAAFAEEVIVDALPMKDFLDPQGLFSIRVPKNFYTLRRTQKGDLPNAKTGKGRRGSSIFTAGDMSKAEVIAIERFPTRVLLEEASISVSTDDLSKFSNFGTAKGIASLMTRRRDQESNAAGITSSLVSANMSDDGKSITFRIESEIEVQKPELLMEQLGVSKLVRITVAKATLDANDDNIMVAFASALEKDFNNGMDGPALEEAVNTFTAFDNSASLVASSS